MTFYTNKLIPSRFAGITYQIWFTPLSVILIRPKYRSDKGLLAHEQTHAKQIRHNWLWFLFYNFSKKYRLKYEAEAYRVQATFLSSLYNLDISYQDALKHWSRHHRGNGLFYAKGQHNRYWCKCRFAKGGYYTYQPDSWWNNGCIDTLRYERTITGHIFLWFSGSAGKRWLYNDGRWQG